MTDFSIRCRFKASCNNSETLRNNGRRKYDKTSYSLRKLLGEAICYPPRSVYKKHSKFKHSIPLQVYNYNKNMNLLKIV